MQRHWKQLLIAIASAAGLANAQGNFTQPFTLPQNDDDYEARAAEIERTRDDFIYGPGVGSEDVYFPNGTLGRERVELDIEKLGVVSAVVRENASRDAAEVLAAAEEFGEFKDLDDFLFLYDGKWERSIPTGIYPGVLQNYTEDLLFSMERLSVQPYTIRRLHPDEDLPFDVDEPIALKLASQSVLDLQKTGRLFYNDYSHLAKLDKNEKYGAACEAYFFIHKDSGDFLPLAIKTNTATPSLVYTPEDDKLDWRFAKMMFNQNDFWDAAWYHLAATHYVFEIVYIAAVRTLSREHPIRPILDRLAEQAFAFRPNAARTLFQEGTYVDQTLPWNGRIAANYTNEHYNAEAGKFQSNYFRENLRSRGLIDSDGPDLTTFPFYEDASKLLGEIEGFFKTMVDSYYATNEAVGNDQELQAWLLEANGPAEVRDFPSAPAKEKQTVVEILSHIAYLVSVAHQTLNTDVPVHSTATLPFHPLAFYKELPTEKGVDSIMPFMPNVTKSVTQIALLANFNRPGFIDSDFSLTEMFNNRTMLSAMNEETRKAAASFKTNLEDFSDDVQARVDRGFDEDGLSQGMPFIWNALDPRIAPYFLSV